MKQWLNIRDPRSGKRRSACLNPETGIMETSDGAHFSLDSIEKSDPEGTGYFETRDGGKVIQKVGKFLGFKK